MNDNQFQEAVKIILRSNSPKVSFNVPVKDNYANVHKILIHESNATLIKELVMSGYSLYMNSKGLSVDNHSSDSSERV